MVEPEQLILFLELQLIMLDEVEVDEMLTELQNELELIEVEMVLIETLLLDITQLLILEADEVDDILELPELAPMDELDEAELLL